MNTKVTDIIASIYATKFTRSELKQINSAVVATMRAGEAEVATQFRIGQRVKFIGRQSRTVFGTVIKVNLKSVKVKADENVTWKVSPSLLTVIA